MIFSSLDPLIGFDKKKKKKNKAFKNQGHPSFLPDCGCVFVQCHFMEHRRACSFAYLSSDLVKFLIIVRRRNLETEVHMCCVDAFL